MPDKPLSQELIAQLNALRKAISDLERSGYDVLVKHQPARPLAMGRRKTVAIIRNKYIRDHEGQYVPFADLITYNGQPAEIHIIALRYNASLLHIRANSNDAGICDVNGKWGKDLPPLKFKEAPSAPDLDQAAAEWYDIDPTIAGGVVKLSVEGSEQMQAWLNNPPPPNEALMKARQNYLTHKETPKTCICKHCSAVWVKYPKSFTGSLGDTVGLKSQHSCEYCENNTDQVVTDAYTTDMAAVKVVMSIVDDVARTEAIDWLICTDVQPTNRPTNE